jgi:nucleoside-diphosphate-sugar epimerase
MKILLTGITGFLGSAISSRLVDGQYKALVRKKNHITNSPGSVVVSDMTPAANYGAILENISVIIHCAARVHVMNDNSREPLDEFRVVNTYGTQNLAKQAAQAGVKRFIFLSSIKVNGESTQANFPFLETDCFIPSDPYGQSKYEAEQGLLEIAEKTDMEVVIIRPTLIYGSGVKGNFFSIIYLIKKNLPLPLDSVTSNKRSLIALDNLVDFILLCADYKKTPQAANEIFLISDGEDVSTAELFHRVAKAFGKKSRLFPFSVPLLRLGAKLLGKQDMADRLLGSLQVDSAKARDLLGWKPVITMEEQLRKMAEVDSGCG